MNSIGIDVSKGKSAIAVMRPFGEVVLSPVDVDHTDSELSKLASCSKAWTVKPEWSWRPQATIIYQLPKHSITLDSMFP